MLDYNAYVAYKRDTKYLLFWTINTSNSIIESLPVTDDGAELNLTGRTTVSGFLAMAELIAKHIQNIPSLVLRLFKSAIAARSRAYTEFQRLAVHRPDIEQLNAAHKHFIDALTTAFQVLGGDEWEGKAGAKGPMEDVSEESIRELLFQNRFSALGLGDGDAASDSESSASETPKCTAPRRRAQKKAGHGKGRKKGKRGKKAAPKVQEKEAGLKGIPFESCRIIESEVSNSIDYFMAISALALCWVTLRQHIQGVWHDVAYDGLNSAVAGAISNIAVSMVKQTEVAIFVDFPDLDSYEIVTHSLMGGDPNKVEGKFSFTTYHGPDRSEIRESNIDLQEQLMWNTYRDLADFITDFQKTRGKPTKRMLAELRAWDPDLDLQAATPETRLRWRRAYTINWLYDLVNVFSSIVVEQNATKGEHHVLENVDWSSRGPWGQDRRLFGLNDFAAFVTTLAMQKPGTDVRMRIF
ncbi:hypothetical protein IMZ48_32180, partial [Candidatus Bathyarchaeota archaeon]|nr:hypothetical protein [Candidatus Bathyarchaeota archaeon]